MKLFCLMFGLALLVSGATVYGQNPSLPQEIDPQTTQAYSLLVERRVKVQAQLGLAINPVQVVLVNMIERQEAAGVRRG